MFTLNVTDMDKINIASSQAPPSAQTRAQSLPRH